jgi:methylglyoxal synthase
MKNKQVKTIALIAHDNKKAEMVNWAMKNKSVLEKYELCGTGTTAKLVADATDLKVKRYLSGPLGGDQQIGAKIAEKKIDFVVFFWDPLASQPHDPDVKALLRISVVYDIPIATNKATADFVIHSTLLEN